MTKKQSQEKITKVSQKTKDKSGNNTHIFNLFLSTSLTRPVSLNGEFCVKSEPQLHFSKHCQCHGQQIIFKDISYLLYQSLRYPAEHQDAWEQHCNSHLDGDMKDLRHGITASLDQNKDEMGRPMLNHITSFCFYRSLFFCHDSSQKWAKSRLIWTSKNTILNV